MTDTYHPNVLLLASALTGRQVKVANTSRQLEGRLWQSARSHGVLALLHRCVQAGNVHGLTNEDLNALCAETRALAIHDLLLNEDTTKTLDLLAAAAVPALLLKGTPVAFRYYKDTYLRTRCDTDLFIAQADRHKAAEVLSATGYRVSGLGQRTNASKQFGAVCAQGRCLATSFDVHWKLSNRLLFKDMLSFEDCWKTRQPLPVLGGNAYTLCPARLLLHACIHRIAHGRNTDRNRLLWLYDIHCITATFSQADFDEFLQMALEKKVGALCWDALVMSQYYFRTRYPAHHLTGLARNQGHEPTARLIKAAKLRWVLADLVALGTLREKAAFTRELLFPPSLSEQRGMLPKLRSWATHLLSRIG